MLSVQHMMCTLLANGGNMDDFRKRAAYVILPDAIRGVGIDRAITHFEESSYENKNDISYFKYPLNLKDMSKEDIQDYVKTNAYLSPERMMAVVGEWSHIEKFYETNQHLSKHVFTCIEDHLKQDDVFDHKIREWIDMFDKENDKYIFQDRNGDTHFMDGKECRELIADIEQYCIEVAAHQLYTRDGITFNQDFIQNECIPSVERDFPECIHNCIGYMKIRDDVNERITQHDTSKLHDGPIPYEWATQMFRDVCDYMNNGKNHYVHDERVAQADGIYSVQPTETDVTYQCE